MTAAQRKLGRGRFCVVRLTEIPVHDAMSFMRYALIAATDGGNVALWDPGALPSDVDEKLQKDWGDTIESLHRHGRVYWPPAYGDGDWILHLFFDEPLPDVPVVKGEGDLIAEFHVPTGELWFVGAEYLGLNAQLREKWSLMGESVHIEPGVYRVDWQTVLHKNLHLERKEKWKSDAGKGNVRFYNAVIGAGFMGALVVVISLVIFRSSFLGCTGGLAAGILLLGAAIAISTGQRFTKLYELKDKARRECPHYIALMERVSAADGGAQLRESR
ncbi:MAG TPA: hypothetical protein VHM90_12400 [Phycisphaerae bacterium]|nr:hypothetical protein [Phycisphaerae bacterium]